MVVISSSIVCCSKCKVFTHSTVWWNQLYSLGNTFIHKDVSVSQLKRQRNQPSIFMDILWGNFLPKPWCLWDTGWGQTWSPCSLCSPPSTIRKKTCPVLLMTLLLEVIFAIFCEILSIILCTHSVIHVINIRFGHIPHSSIYLNSNWIYWFWKLLIALVSL